LRLKSDKRNLCAVRWLRVPPRQFTSGENIMSIVTALRAAMLSALLFAPVLLAQAASKDADITGVPVTGAAGITEKVSDIMARARVDDARPRGGPRIKYEFENEYRERLRNNPDAPAVAFWPPMPGQGAANIDAGVTPHAAQTVSTPNFTGATLADANAFPPDTMGTVGPTQFIVAINGRIRSFNKTTGIADGALNVSTDTFFASVMTPPVASNFTSDPRIRYDRLSGRWFLVIIDVPGTMGALANRVMVAVSSGDTIASSASFTFYQFQMSGTLFADYPTLGIDANALYIGANMFTLAGSFSSTLGSVVRKSSVLSGGPIVTTTFPAFASGAGAGPFTPQGVDNYDPAATEGYFVGVDNATFSTLMVRRVSTPGGTPTVSANLSITVPSTSSPLKVPHSGNTGGTNGNLDGLDDRLYAAHVRNGRIWTAHNIGTTSAGVGSGTRTRNSVRWYELGTLTTTPTLIQSGTIFNNAASNPEFYFIPSVMVSGQGHAAFGFSMAGLLLTPNAGTIGRLSGDAAGTVQTPIVNYSASTAAYNPPSDPGGSGGRRWGDYSYTSLDPCDDMTMWTIQEFANATNSYGVRAVRLLAPAPVATNCASATDIQQGQSNVNIALTGTGFFQPAADVGSCRILLASALSGTGVTINSTTYNSPTSLTLNISATAGASVGPRTITVTNPDGQQTATATSCINVIAGAATTTASSLNRVGSGNVCAGQSVSWQSVFAASVAGVATGNFALNGGTGASVTAVSGSGTTRTIDVNVGTAAGPLRLDMVNSTGVTPTVTGLPFTGESITVNANPSAFNVTGGGTVCSGAGGIAVGLSGSQTGVNYQLNRNSVAIGPTVAGTGAAISFGPQTLAGNYTVSASNGATSCAASMSGSVDVVVNPTPTPFVVNGGGSFCAGGSGVPVGLAGSEMGVNYQLFVGAAPVGAPVPGTGAALSFGNQTTAGTYSVNGTHATSSCVGGMIGGPTTVTVNPAPSVDANTPAAICTGSTTAISLSSTPGGATFAYTASNTSGAVTGFSGGSANPIAQALTGSGNITYAVTATLGSCPGAVRNILQPVSDPTPAATALPNGTDQLPYSVTLTAPGSLQTPQFSVVTGSLPTGVTLSSAGLLSGTPTATGTFNFTVSGSDPSIASCAFNRAFALEILVRDIFQNGFE
jgi:hypothetical protein